MGRAGWAEPDTLIRVRRAKCAEQNKSAMGTESSQTTYMRRAEWAEPDGRDRVVKCVEQQGL